MVDREFLSVVRFHGPQHWSSASKVDRNVLLVDHDPYSTVIL